MQGQKDNLLSLPCCVTLHIFHFVDSFSLCILLRAHRSFRVPVTEACLRAQKLLRPLGIHRTADLSLLHLAQTQANVKIYRGKVSAGGNFTAVVSDASRLWTFGEGKDWRLAAGDGNSSHTALAVSGAIADLNIDSVSCGDNFGAVLTATGEVFLFGSLRTTKDQPLEHVPFPEGVRVMSVCCGGLSSVAVGESGEVFTWGRNTYGQLGHNNLTDSPVPRSVQGLERIVNVACGHGHTAAVCSVGKLWTFGDGEGGRLGHGDHHWRPRPTLVTRLLHARTSYVACGVAYTVAVTPSGALYSWGRGGHGRLGHGDEFDRLVPTAVAGLRGVDISSADCGIAHTAAVTVDGKLYTFGHAGDGRLGHGSDGVLEDELVPRLVKALDSTAVAAVACGFDHTVVTARDGRVFTFGWGGSGQLGHGSWKTVNVPTCLESVRCLPTWCGPPWTMRRGSRVAKTGGGFSRVTMIDDNILR